MWVILVSETVTLNFVEFDDPSWHRYLTAFVLDTLPGLLAIALLRVNWLIWLVVLTQIYATIYIATNPEEAGFSHLVYPLVQWPILILIFVSYLFRRFRQSSRRVPVLDPDEEAPSP